MANTYTLINSNTVGSGGVPSVTFSSIAGTYTDLLVKASATTNGSSPGLYVSFNGVTTNRSSKYLLGTGSAASSGSDTTIYDYAINYSGTTANTFGNADIYIPNYASANYKSLSIDGVMENNATLAYMGLSAGLWSNTSAITSLTLTPETGSFIQYSSFYLYGIKNS